jgi:hypothetical protein
MIQVAHVSVVCFYGGKAMSFGSDADADTCVQRFLGAEYEQGVFGGLFDTEAQVCDC